MLTFCGFNGFRQFGGEHEQKVLNFKGTTVADALKASSNILCAPSWSYVAFAVGHDLMLSGFLSKKTNSKYKLTATDVIKALCACDRFCLVLLQNGKLFKLLPEIDAELQEIRFASAEPTRKRSIFGNLTSEPFQIQHIACGNNITVAISKSNTVYNIPSEVHKFPRYLRVQQLLCGFEHALLLSTNGDIYSWGQGLRGQLGLDEINVEESPVLVEALAGIKITFIAAGGWHSAAISVFGDLYTWGFNTNGALGLRVFKSCADSLKQPSVFPLPQLMELPKCSCHVATDAEADDDACTPLKVFAGARHTVVQMCCGALYATGWNAHGQLGLHTDSDFCDEFRRINCFKDDDEEALNVICGPWCTVVIK